MSSEAIEETVTHLSHPYAVECLQMMLKREREMIRVYESYSRDKHLWPHGSDREGFTKMAIELHGKASELESAIRLLQSQPKGE